MPRDQGPSLADDPCATWTNSPRLPARRYLKAPGNRCFMTPVSRDPPGSSICRRRGANVPSCMERPCCRVAIRHDTVMPSPRIATLSQTGNADLAPWLHDSPPVEGPWCPDQLVTWTAGAPRRLECQGATIPCLWDRQAYKLPVSTGNLAGRRGKGPMQSRNLDAR